MRGGRRGIGGSYFSDSEDLKAAEKIPDDEAMATETPSLIRPGETPAEADKRRKDERRRSNRKPYVAEAWLSSPTATDPADRVEVTSLNVSKHGIAFDLPVAIPTGVFYVLRLGMGPQKLVTEVRVVSCRPGDESFHVGAEFC